MNKNILLYIVLWIISIRLYIIKKKWSYLLIPYIFFIVNELSNIITGLDLMSSSDRTALFYDTASWYTNYAGIDPNYSEGYYINDNYNISSREAENNKFEKFLQLLGAKAGDTILNLGCGTCTFERYCKTKNIKVVALSLSSYQIKECAKYNIEGYVHDYRKFNPDFVNKFDYIIFMGSSEHMYSGSCVKYKTYVKKHENLKNQFEILKKYLKPNGRIMHSELHLNPKYIKTDGTYFLERVYGGTVTLDSENLNAHSAAEKAGFKTLYKRDATKDYYMATVLDEKHFGSPNNPFSFASIGLFLSGFIYPPAWLFYIYGMCGYWMWMFDGRLHFHNNKRYMLKDVSERPYTLWWLLFEKSS